MFGLGLYAVIGIGGGLGVSLVIGKFSIYGGASLYNFSHAF